jgi:tape measure domain-containing protein
MAGSLLNLGIRIGVEGQAQAAANVKKVESSLTSVGNEAQRVSGIASSLGRNLASLAAVVGLGLSVGEFVQQADAMALMDARLKNAVGSGQEFARAQKAIYEISQANNIGLAEAGQLYTKLAGPVARVGGSTKETTGIVNAFATSLRVGGASAQEASSATLQFAQAMGSGRLSGDEFRAMAEASPAFMKALADGMGKPIETLKSMGTEGKLTADVVGNALLKSMGNLKAQAKALPDTVGGAFTRIRNDVLMAVNAINQQSGLTLGLAGIMEIVRLDILPVLKDELTAAFATVGRFIKDNEKELQAVWTTVKGVGRDLLEIARVVGTVVMAIADWAVKSGALQLVFETLRRVIAGLSDGVLFLSGAFARAGQLLLEIGGIVSPTLAQMARDAETYADGVFERFAEGKTATGALNAELERTRVGTINVEAALRSNSLSVAENASEMTRLMNRSADMGGEYTRLKPAVVAATREATEQADAYKKLTQSIQTKIVDMRAELGQTEDLTAVQRLQVDVYNKIALGLLALSPKQKAAIGDLFTEALATEALAEKKDAEAAARDKARTAVEKQIAATAKEMESIEAKNLSLDDEIARQVASNSTVGDATAALARLEVAKLRESAATAERNALIAMEIAGHEGVALAFFDQAEKLGALAALKEQGIHIQAARDSAAEWKKTTDAIGDGITDALFRGFENGLGFIENLKTTLINTFKTMVLRPTVSAIVNPIAGGAVQGLGNMLGIPGMSAAGAKMGGGGGVLGAMGGLTSLVTDFGGSIAFGADSLGQWLTTNTTGALNNLGGTLMENAGAIGDFAGAAGTAVGYLSAISALADKQYGRAAGSAIGTYFGGPIGAYIGGEIGGWVDKVARGGAGTPHTGSVVSTNSAGSETMWDTDGSTILNNYNAGTDEALRYVSGVSVNSLNNLSKEFGLTGGYSSVARFAADGRDASIGQFLLDRAGFSEAGTAGMVGQVDDYARYSADGQEAFKQFASDVAGITRTALFQIDLPAWAKKQLNGLAADADITAIKAVADTIIVMRRSMIDLQRGLAPLGGIFADVAGLSEEALYSLLEFSGGIENFATQAASFVRNYYSDDEQASLSAKTISDTLTKAGLDVASLKTRDEFRALVNSRDLGTETGRKQLAALLAAADSFASLSDYLVENDVMLGGVASTAPTVGVASGIVAGTPVPAEQPVIDGLTAVSNGIDTMADRLEAAIEQLRESVEIGQAAIVDSTNATTRLLNSWDNGDGLNIYTMNP